VFLSYLVNDLFTFTPPGLGLISTLFQQGTWEGRNPLKKQVPENGHTLQLPDLSENQEDPLFITRSGSEPTTITLSIFF
jgi:hypothetical protein